MGYEMNSDWNRVSQQHQNDARWIYSRAS
jgi:hypothetical protein